MAQRRMFSLKIIDTDYFLDMPVSARELYFQFGMRADDDGFVGSPKRIMKMIGATDDDYRMLIAKQFIIEFNAGVCVIKHWKVHNYIQNDRYTETIYANELNQLASENGMYTKCIQDGNTGKVSIGKVSKNKDIIEGNQSLKKDKDYEITKQFYNDLIEIVDPPRYKKNPPNLDSWSKHIGLLHERDGIPYETMPAVWKWAFHHSFWKGNVLSTEKFRKQYNTLWIQFESEVSKQGQDNESWRRLAIEKSD